MYQGRARQRRLHVWCGFLSLLPCFSSNGRRFSVRCRKYGEESSDGLDHSQALTLESDLLYTYRESGILYNGYGIDPQATRLNFTCHLIILTLTLLISYIYGAPSKARNANVYIYGTTFGNAETVSFYLLHNVSTLNQCREVSCKQFASYLAKCLHTNVTQETSLH